MASQSTSREPAAQCSLGRAAVLDDMVESSVNLETPRPAARTFAHAPTAVARAYLLIIRRSAKSTSMHALWIPIGRTTTTRTRGSRVVGNRSTRSGRAAACGRSGSVSASFTALARARRLGRSAGRKRRGHAGRCQLPDASTNFEDARTTPGCQSRKARALLAEKVRRDSWPTTHRC